MSVIRRLEKKPVSEVMELRDYITQVGFMKEMKRIVLDPDYQRDYVYTDYNVKKIIGPFFRDGYIGEITVMPYFIIKEGVDNVKEITSILTITNGRQRTETMYRIVRNEIPISSAILKKYYGYRVGKSMYFSELPENIQNDILSMNVTVTYRLPQDWVVESDDIKIKEKWNEHVREVFRDMNKNLKRVPRVEALMATYYNYGQEIKKINRMAKEVQMPDWRGPYAVVYLDIIAFTLNPISHGGVRNPSWAGIDDITLTSSQFIEKAIEERENFYKNYPVEAETHKAKLENLMIQLFKKYKMLTDGEPLLTKFKRKKDTRSPGTLPLVVQAALIPYPISYLHEKLEIEGAREKLISAIEEAYFSTDYIVLEKKHGDKNEITIRELFISQAMNSTRLRTALNYVISEVFIPILGNPIELKREYNRQHKKFKPNKGYNIHTWPPASVPAENREYYLVPEHLHTHALHGPRAIEMMETLKKKGKIIKLE